MKAQSYRSYLDWAFEQLGLDPTDRHVLLQLAKFGYSSGEVFASQATIADKTGYSVSTVGRSIRRLAKRRLILEVTSDHAIRATKTYRFACKISKPSPRQNDRPPAAMEQSAPGHRDIRSPKVNQKDESRTGGGAHLIGSSINRLMSSFGQVFDQYITRRPIK